MDHCIYCPRPIFTSGLTTPMCEEHLELTLIKFHLRRDGQPFTPGRVILEKKRMEASGLFLFKFRFEDVVPLINEMTTEDYIPVTHTAATVAQS